MVLLVGTEPSILRKLQLEIIAFEIKLRIFCAVDAIIIVRICCIPAKMVPRSSSPDAMMMGNPIKLYHHF
jgi:hypothetical protein